MGKCSREGRATRCEVRGWLEAELRRRTRTWIVELVEEELETALGASRHERAGERCGYRHGRRERSFTTRNGKHLLSLPRGRLAEGGGGSREWHSQLLPRYARRSEAVEEALVAAYLTGTNTRKVRQALEPLLRGAELSRSTVSRMVCRLRAAFCAWAEQDWSQTELAILILDGMGMEVRLGGKVERVPVLAAVGITAGGEKVLLGLEVRNRESGPAWAEFCESLAQRGVRAPALVIIDGHRGLRQAVRSAWPGAEVQRCTVHKLRNLLTHAPKRLHPELRGDYHAIIYAGSAAQAQAAHQRFLGKWGRLCPAVAQSLEEGGEELLTFYRWPQAMWKSLRSTNGIERLYGEFRRRTKTQGSFPDADSALVLLWGLVASGTVRLRRIDGWRALGPYLSQHRSGTLAVAA